ncbi:MAG TPA: UDPGP type 1 family protein [Pirellulales bacterium]|nr:UDPGP type 1 family protein [Pirellulales bacterium]
MASINKEQLKQQLRSSGQEHLLRFWDDLNAAEQQRLAGQIAEINFRQIADLFDEANAKTPAGGDNHSARAKRAAPPPAIRLSEQQGAASQQAREQGEQALRDGKIGAVLVAGGQGTRLGFDHPKGLFPIGPLSEAPLFQILFEKLLAVRKRYGVSIPLYIMTSPATHEETVAALDKHARFGLPAEDVIVFCQGTMPAVDGKTGRLLLEERGSLFLSPDGHGGMLRALARGGALADIERRGIEQLFYMQVDNPLVVVCDPLFIGYHLEANSEVSTQVVAKQNPLDRVGNVVSVDGQVQIIEYSDLPDEVAELRDADGSLKLWAGNIAVHVFDVAFLKRMSAGGGKLPFHFANKKVPYVDDSGRPVEPAQPNAIKFEQFIFDLLPAAKRSLVVEVDEQSVFAPVKNGEGAERDTPDTVRRQMITLHRRWLEAAGAKVGSNVRVEISPLFALDAAEVATKVNPSTSITEDRYFK